MRPAFSTTAGRAALALFLLLGTTGCELVGSGDGSGSKDALGREALFEA
jgi:hypothetical protein